eukprot:CAMPEP_0119378122 /NCGR_PEP_ID=MMETSP1334-20130426/47418_1 /TAXON_ID=127549 /ORGANISM="Calcidiscus leptoporus, Strain RCC1130" /LENGTH=32 /DNA_ID= /DNA_START= /DNA_END= /DNA_ORIENTATION=
MDGMLRTAEDIGFAVPPAAPPAPASVGSGGEA